MATIGHALTAADVAEVSSLLRADADGLGGDLALPYYAGAAAGTIFLAPPLEAVA